MTRIPRRSLAAPVEFSGPGIHTGRDGRIRLSPVDDGGIRFVTEERREISAVADRVVDTALSVTLGSEAASVRTVEHLLAALHLLGVTDLRVEVPGPEIPVLDGSARPFVQEIREVGLRCLDKFVEPWHIPEPFQVGSGPRRIEAFPAERLVLDVEIEHAHPDIGRQRWHGDMASVDGETELAPARTFGFLEDGKRLREYGYARGASPENTVIFMEQGIFEGRELRFPDEPVRHKALDLLGDLWLLGRPLLGHVRSFQGGHELNVRFVRELLERNRPT